MANRTTLIELAQAAGVSLSTVDRVVNRRGGVSPAAEARVLEWASRLELDRRIFRTHLRNLRVAVLVQPPQNPFYRAVRDAFNELNIAMADLRITCFIHYIDVTDVKSMREKVDEVASGYDGLIVDFPNDPRLSDVLRHHSAAIPIVTLVTDLPASGRIAYVGPDNRQTGRVAGELMGRFLGPEGGNVLVVLGLHQMTGHEEREMGFRSILRERFPACRITASLESEEDQMRAADVVRAALDEQPDIRGIYNISAGNVAIARTVEAMGLAQRVVMITHELTPARRRLLQDGILDAIIDQNPRLEARRALEVIGHHYQRGGTAMPTAHYTPYDIFIRENCPPDEGSPPPFERRSRT